MKRDFIKKIELNKDFPVISGSFRVNCVVVSYSVCELKR